MQLKLILLFLFFTSDAWATTYYVRTGGSNSTNCTGQANADYDGSGTGEDCAYSHPFYYTGWCGDYPASCTSGSATTSNDLVVVNGSYDVGYDASWSGCNGAFKYGCDMKPFPDGTSLDHSTIKGCTTSGCSNNADRPTFYIAEGEKFALNLSSSDYVDIQDIILKETRSCGYAHPTLSCTNPDNDGVLISNATNITFTDVNIHGFSRYGVFGGPATDISFINSDISYNSFGGLITDTTGSCTTCGWSGTLNFDHLTGIYNGCIEDGTTAGLIVADGCYSQDQSGYGDMIGAAQTAGDWVFTDCNISYNISDGIDLLYQNKGAYSNGSVTIKRLHAEGNTSQQVKVSNNSYIEDSVIIGNCMFFNGKSTTCDAGTCGASFNNCRAAGNTVNFAFRDSTHNPKLYNNTILGNGDVLVVTDGESVCTAGTDIFIKNNILRGGTEFNDGSDLVSVFFNSSASCDADFVESYNLCYGLKEGASACNGSNSTDTVDAAFIGTLTQGPVSYRTTENYINEVYLSASNGLSDETVVGEDSLDFNSTERGADWDVGALEYVAGGAVAPTNSKWYGKIIGSVH